MAKGGGCLPDRGGDDVRPAVVYLFVVIGRAVCFGGKNIYRRVESALYVPGYFANIAFVCRDWVMRRLPTSVNNPITYYNSIHK